MPLTPEQQAAPDAAFDYEFRAFTHPKDRLMIQGQRDLWNTAYELGYEAATADAKRAERERIKRIVPSDLTQFTESSAEGYLEYKRGYYDAMRRLVKQLDPETAD